VNARWAGSFLAAVILHALVLFGLRIQSPARPLEISDQPSPMDVSLVTAAPEAPAPPAPSPPPVPAPTPEPPAAEPTPEISTSPPPEPAPEEEAIAESTPIPALARLSPHHLEQKRPRAALPQWAVAGGAEAGSRGAASGPLSSRASYLSNPRPEYPEEARRQHQEGLVILSVEVSADGRPDDVTVTRGSGFPLLDQAALDAVRSWRFEPARAAGLPVSSHVDVPVRFTLSR